MQLFCNVHLGKIIYSYYSLIKGYLNFIVLHEHIFFSKTYWSMTQFTIC